MAGKTTNLTYKLQARVDTLEKDLSRAKGKLKGFSAQSNAIGREIRANIAYAFSVAAVSNFAKSQIELIKQIDANNKALQAVTGSAEEFATAKQFLSKTAQAYGVEIKNLTSQYVKFQAAVKGTNLEGEQGREVFDKISRAGAVLSLSNEQLEGTFRAIEQMLSKGTVQAEEIRGQLSERLPGAYRILAKSMNLTTEELGKQLKQGKVMAEEVLPAFADELVKTYGAETVKMVDNVTAAQNRLTNAWTEFIEGVDDGGGVISQTYKGILNEISGVLEAIGAADTNTLFALMIGGPGALQQLVEGRKVVKELNDELERRNEIFEKNAQLQSGSGIGPFPVSSGMGMPTDLFGNTGDQVEKIKKEILGPLTNGIGSGAIGDLAGPITAILPSGDDMRAQFEEMREIMNDGLRTVITDVQKLTAELNSIIEFSIENLFVSVGQAIGGGGNLFDAVFKVIGQGLQQIGAAMIAYGVNFEAFKASIKSLQPGVAIAAGTALVAAGSLIANAHKSFSGSMGGGGRDGQSGARNFTGGLRGQSIKIDGGEFVVRGQDLVYVLDRVQQQNARFKSDF